MAGPKKFPPPSELIGPSVVAILVASIVITFVVATILLSEEDYPLEKVVEEEVQTVSSSTLTEIKMIPTTKFDLNEITISASEDVEIVAINEDGSVPHNFSVYTDQSSFDSSGVSAALFTTNVCGPCTESVVINLEAGEYFFQCDVHPVTMIGTITAQ